MGLFDDMLQKATDWTSGSTDEHARLAHSVLEMVSSERSGGIPALVQSCKDHGLSDVINSWIGVGQNMPISAENVDRVLGNEKVKALAAKAGISPEEARNKLAEVLPLVVDKLTPDGKVPDASTLVAAAENFMKKRGGNIPS